MNKKYAYTLIETYGKESERFYKRQEVLPV